MATYTIDQIKLDGNLYDISLPKDASVTVSSLIVTSSLLVNGAEPMTTSMLAEFPKLYINGAAYPNTSGTTIYAPTSQLTATTSKRYLIGSSEVNSLNTVNTNSNCYMSGGYLYSGGNKIDLAIAASSIGSESAPIYLSADQNGNYFSVCPAYAGGTRVSVNGTSYASTTVSIYAPTTAGANGDIWAATGTAPVWFSTQTTTTDTGITIYTSTATDVPSTRPTAYVTGYYCVARLGPSNALISVHVRDLNVSADKHYFIPMSTFSSFCNTNSRVMAIIANPARNTTATGDAASVFTRWWNGSSSLYNQGAGSVAWSDSLCAIVTLDENTFDGFNALIMISNCKFI